VTRSRDGKLQVEMEKVCQYLEGQVLVTSAAGAQFKKCTIIALSGDDSTAVRELLQPDAKGPGTRKERPRSHLLNKALLGPDFDYRNIANAILNTNDFVIFVGSAKAYQRDVRIVDYLWAIDGPMFRSTMKAGSLPDPDSMSENFELMAAVRQYLRDREGKDWDWYSPTKVDKGLSLLQERASWWYEVGFNQETPQENIEDELKSQRCGSYPDFQNYSAARSEEWNQLDVGLNTSKLLGSEHNPQKALNGWMQETNQKWKDNTEFTVEGLKRARSEPAYWKIFDIIPENKFPLIYVPIVTQIGQTKYNDSEFPERTAYSFTAKHAMMQKQLEGVYPGMKITRSSTLTELSDADFRVQFPKEMVERMYELESNTNQRGIDGQYTIEFDPETKRPILSPKKRRIEVSYDAQYREFRHPPRMQDGRVFWTGTGCKMIAPNDLLPGEIEMEMKNPIDWDNITPADPKLEEIRRHPLLMAGEAITDVFAGTILLEARLKYDEVLENAIARYGPSYVLQSGGYHIPDRTTPRLVNLALFSMEEQARILDGESQNTSAPPSVHEDDQNQYPGGTGGGMFNSSDMEPE